MRTRTALTALAAVAMALAACGDDDAGEAADPPGTVATATTAEAGGAGTTTSPPVSQPADTTTTSVAPATTAPPSPDEEPTVRDERLVGGAETGGVVWDVVYPQVSGTGADAAINEVLAGEAQQALDAWRADVATWEPVDDLPSDYFAGYEVTLLDDRYLSILVSGSVYYSGAAHPSGTVSSSTFELDTGRLLALPELFVEGSPWAERLADAAQASLTEELGELMAGFDPIDAGTDFSVFNLTPDGLLVTFRDGQVGPHAIGMPSFEVPHGDLADIAAPGGPLDR